MSIPQSEEQLPFDLDSSQTLIVAPIPKIELEKASAPPPSSGPTQIVDPVKVLDQEVMAPEEPNPF